MIFDGEAFRSPDATVGEMVTAMSGGISRTNENTYMLVGTAVPTYLLRSPANKKWRKEIKQIIYTKAGISLSYRISFEVH